jgi:hypothetical protein
MSPMQRANVIAGRLNKAFASGITANDLHVSMVGNQTVLMAGNMPIATVDAMSACLQGMSKSALASRWVGQTRMAMAGTAVQSNVAGTQQQFPSTVTWQNSPTKIVPILNASTGAQMGNATIAGTQSALDSVNSVVLYHTTSSNADVWTFVPIMGNSTTGTLNRVDGVGIASVPQTLLPQMSSLQTGSAVTGMINQNSGTWSSAVTSALSQNNVPMTSSASTRIVPLYSTDSSQVIGGAQIAGAASDVNQVQSVASTSQGDTYNLVASSVTSPVMATSNPINGAVVTSIITIPTSSSMSPGTGTSGSMPSAPLAPAAPPAPSSSSSSGNSSNY